MSDPGQASADKSAEDSSSRVKIASEICFQTLRRDDTFLTKTGREVFRARPAWRKEWDDIGWQEMRSRVSEYFATTPKSEPMTKVYKDRDNKIVGFIGAWKRDKAWLEKNDEISNYEKYQAEWEKNQALSSTTEDVLSYIDRSEDLATALKRYAQDDGAICRDVIFDTHMMCENYKGDHWWQIAHLGVLLNSRRKRAGSYLVNQIQERAWRDGRIPVYVRSEYAAVDFYKALDFELLRAPNEDEDRKYGVYLVWQPRATFQPIPISEGEIV
ncbi:hypothetical protein GGR57DRAFT_506187 [Xylariaceae sp. FL1272]|nr:hypothetical protein GGR57DRAFT_506187 [Xylariaceae sp. FL1272]